MQNIQFIFATISANKEQYFYVLSIFRII